LQGADAIKQYKWVQNDKLALTLDALEKRLAQPQKVTVEVKDGNITASVNEANAREARRK
jgi:hypothetical protein